MNILGIDFEDWFHPELIQKAKFKVKKEPKVIQGIHKILELLRQKETKATFFVVGELLEYKPELLDLILENDHEIGFHTMKHNRIDSSVSKEKFDDEIKKFKKLTDDKSKGFRAPSFSLNANSSWLIDVLEENEYIYDSSVVPAKTNLYGIPNAEQKPYRISSNVLEHLGIKFTNNENKLQESIDKSGICFLHAPLFHPAMKNVAHVRKELGLKTIFNILGPLVNPSEPTKQIVGVFNLKLARTYNYFFQKTKKKFAVIYSLDGYDEISLTGDAKIYNNQKEFILKPEQLGLLPINANDIIGGNDVDSSAKIFMNILNNNATEHQKNVVCCNAAMAISTSKNISLIDAFNLAKESIDSKSALKASIAFCTIFLPTIATAEDTTVLGELPFSRAASAANNVG